MPSPLGPCTMMNSTSASCVRAPRRQAAVASHDEGLGRLMRRLQSSASASARRGRTAITSFAVLSAPAAASDASGPVAACAACFAKARATGESERLHAENGRRGLLRRDAPPHAAPAPRLRQPAARCGARAASAERTTRSQRGKPARRTLQRTRLWPLRLAAAAHACDARCRPARGERLRRGRAGGAHA